jgi:hypothetical protein
VTHPMIRMRNAWALAAASLALLTGQAARADATYTLVLNGTAHHTFNCWEILSQCAIGPPVPPDERYAWTGTISVVVDSSADGTYADADFLSLAFVANLGGVTLNSFEHSYPAFGQVTVTNGLVSSLDVTDPLLFPDSPTPGGLVFSGLSATYSQPPLHHFGETDAFGTLTPIPEPGTDGLMLAGLGCLGYVARGRKRN